MYASAGCWLITWLFIGAIVACIVGAMVNGG
jgi:hypothetical protein